MISVCMATYNGSQWINTQLQSVLKQLSDKDEVVVVDDVSSDDTIIKIQALNDHRIRLFSNEINMGVDQTFQKALSLAQGDILFLCDQDDLWYPQKVSRIKQVFDLNPDISLVLSDAQIIDSDDCVTGPTYFSARGEFIPGVFANIAKSKFLGCSMAIKSDMRDYFLPFPTRIPGHDMWIGLINEYYGKTFFISEPLFGYRRHGNNLSPANRQNIRKMLIWRWQLISGLLKRIIHIKWFGL